MPDSVVEKNNRRTSLLSVHIKHQPQAELQIPAVQKVKVDIVPSFTFVITDAQQQ